MKTKLAPIIIAVIIPVVSVFIALTLVYFKKKNLSVLEDFSYAEYLSSPKNLSGNSYLLNAEIELQLVNLGDKGRVVAVRTDKGDKLAVLIPASIVGNIVTKQRYAMEVLVGDNGRITVKSMGKY